MINKETIKKLLKPDWRRITLTIFLFCFVFLALFSLTTGMYVEPFGYQEPLLGFELGLKSALFVSFILTYLISCLVIFILERIGMKR